MASITSASATTATSALPESYWAKIGEVGDNSPIPTKPIKFDTLTEVVAATNNWSKFKRTREYWQLRIEGGGDYVYGKVEAATVKAVLENVPERELLDGEDEQEGVELRQGWVIDANTKTMTLLGIDPASRSSNLHDTWSVLKPLDSTDPFLTLKKHRNENEPVYGPDGLEVFRCERSMTVMFGLPGYGALALAYFIDENGEYKFSIGLREKNKATYGHMWDVVFGGCSSVENDGSPSTAVQTFITEGNQEASLTEEFLIPYSTPIGVVSYTTVRDHVAVKGQTTEKENYDYFVHDDCMTIFLVKTTGPIPTLGPKDGEVERFEEVNVAQLIQGMRQGDFKPNCALTIAYVLLRMGLLAHLDESDREGVTDLVFSKPDFTLKQDIRNTLATLGYDSIEAQRASLGEPWVELEVPEVGRFPIKEAGEITA